MDDDLQTLLNYAYFFLKFRPRTKKEVRAYLLKKIKKRHWSTDDVEKAIKQLEEQNKIVEKILCQLKEEKLNAKEEKSLST